MPCLRLPTIDPYPSGNVVVGDEHGVQGRFHKYFGDPLNAIFKSHSIPLRFADFKCARSNYSGVPDVIMMDDSHEVKVIGELKVPWVDEHSIENRIRCKKELRISLAQPIQCMQQLQCAYGFFSNYNETIFLRQVVDNQGVWRIEYSPVILTTYNNGMNPPVVSARQCFFYVECEALNQGPANNTTAGWVERH